MAYQKRNKSPRYASTGNPVTARSRPGDVKNAAYSYKTYLAGLMKKLQNAARQKVFRARMFAGPCALCGENDTTKFYVEYSVPTVMDLCASCHKESSQHRGSIYDQLVRHKVDVISWEDWKNGLRPVAEERK